MNTAKKMREGERREKDGDANDGGGEDKDEEGDSEDGASITPLPAPSEFFFDDEPGEDGELSRAASRACVPATVFANCQTVRNKSESLESLLHCCLCADVGFFTLFLFSNW